MIEDDEVESTLSPIEKAVHDIGIADYHISHHVIPFSFASPISLYFQFIHNHNHSNYQEASLNYATLQDYYPWWKEGIDRYSSVLYILKQNTKLSSLFHITNQFEPKEKEVI